MPLKKFALLFSLYLLLAACVRGNPPPPPPTTPNTQATLTALATQANPTTVNDFALTSPAVTEGGNLPKDYTCDGSSATLPLEWRNAPAGTKSLAVIMHHVPGPGDTHWYWVLYDIPATVTALPQNVTGLGTLGNNSVNSRAEYAPPCSKGPGAKLYTYTVYALSAAPQLTLPHEQVSRDVLLAAIQNLILASATLNVVYTR